jgi:hypothetical protein
MRYENDPDGARLPIKVDTTSNGEFTPRPLGANSVAANDLAHSHADVHARRTNMNRRNFLASSCGAASTLLAFNEAHAAFGKTGGFYDVPTIAALDAEAADATLNKREFIFDIQGHHVNPVDRWRAKSRGMLQGLKFFPHGKCDYIDEDSPLGYIECFTGKAFIKEMFMDSDTDIAVLTFTPTTFENMPLTEDEALATRELVAALEGDHRLLLHGRVIPNLDGDIERMTEMRETMDVAAWKTYTQASVDGKSGWWLDDDEYGGPLIEAARQSGVNVICVHKGLPLPNVMMRKNYEYGSCRDIGVAAKQNPDMNFIIYHSGFDLDIPDQGFVSGDNPHGVDSLVQSLQDNGLGPNSNVYAELGSTWRYVMRDPDRAAHVIGKLLKYVGEDNVVWGTDCIWYGSPQDQIHTFRTFQISEEFQEKYGYPEITPEIRAKVFGLNAVKPYRIEPAEVQRHLNKDSMQQARENYRGREDPSFLTYGPKTRREFLDFLRLSQT